LFAVEAQKCFLSNIVSPESTTAYQFQAFDVTFSSPSSCSRFVPRYQMKMEQKRREHLTFDSVFSLARFFGTRRQFSFPSVEWKQTFAHRIVVVVVALDGFFPCLSRRLISPPKA
jgi:hypothetical protein